MNNTISGRIDQASAILGITSSELKIAFTVKGDPSDELIEIILNRFMYIERINYSLWLAFVYYIAILVPINKIA